ncbi:hypothetical protein AEQ27_09460 [Frigoribacterium sp. RIT-PI-h]|nr:hypothetical protein AEQ27_09460 [Frigoribacterium sp. RIT-PI-h]
MTGTYTEESCEFIGRLGCKSVGTWISDDKKLTYSGVVLSGAVGPDGISYAIPNSVLGGTDTVYGSTVSPLLGVVVAIVFLVMLALGVLRAADKWGDLARLSNSSKRRKALEA